MIRIPFVLLWNLLRTSLAFPFNLIRLCFPLKADSYAYVRIEEGVPRWIHQHWLMERFQGSSEDATLSEWNKALDKLAALNQLKGLIIEINELDAGLPVVHELREALQRFREVGKEVVVVPRQMGPGEYYLASAADRIILSPAAPVHLMAPAMSSFFFGDTLRMLGVDPQIVRAGKHKNAPENFIRRFPSPTNRADIKSLLEDYRRLWFADLAKSRGIEQSVLEEQFERGIFSAEEALEAGLIDAIRFPERVLAYLRAEDAPAFCYPEDPVPPSLQNKTQAAEATGPDAPHTPGDTAENTVEEADLAPSEQQKQCSQTAQGAQDDQDKQSSETSDKASGTKAKPAELTPLADIPSAESVLGRRPRWLVWTPLRRTPSIGVIPVHGTIQDRGSGNVAQEQVASRDQVLRAIESASSNPRIKAVVVWIDSRGGSGTASEAMWWGLRDLSQRKPVVAFMDNYAASGGYYVACATEYIVSSPWCITGSIGVFGGKFVVQRLLDRLELGMTVVGESLGSRLLSPFHRLHQEEEERLREQMLDFYHRFVHRVADGRGLTPEEVDQRGGGKVFFGQEAKELRLADACGGIELAFDKARSLAGLSSDVGPRLLSAPPRFSLRSLLTQSRLHAWSDVSTAPLPRFSSEISQTLSLQELQWLHEIRWVVQTLQQGGWLAWSDGLPTQTLR